MQEVEILWKLDETIESALNKLKNAVFVSEKYVNDEYFVRKDIPETIPDAQGKLIGCLRLRSSAKGVTLTFKKDYFQRDKWSHSDEQEIELQDVNSARTFLHSQGFDTLLTLRINKRIFSYENYEITFEETDELGNFIEVERIGNFSQEEINKTKQEIRKIIKESGIKVGDELNIGKPELALQKHHNFTENT